MKTNYFSAKTFLFFGSLFLTSIAYSQSVKGILLNQKTQEPVPYAEISVGDEFFTVTNAEGNFHINEGNFSVNDSITFFSYGFLPKKIAVADINSEEIFITRDESIYPSGQYVNTQQIMQKVNERLEQNYANEFSKLKIYHSTHSTSYVHELKLEKLRANFLDKEIAKSMLTKINNIFEKQKDRSTVDYSNYVADVYIGEEEQYKLNLTKASVFSEGRDPQIRQLFQNEILGLVEDKMHLNSTYKVKSGLFKIEEAFDFKNICKSPDSTFTKFTHKKFEELMDNHSFYPSVDYAYSFIQFPHQYIYKLEQITEVKGEKVLVLSFAQNKNKGRYSGKLYISAEDFAVRRADYQVVEGEGMKINLKFLLGFKAETNDKFGTIIFSKNASGKYAPRFVSSSEEVTSFGNRKVKFKENSDTGKKHKIRTEFTVERTALVTHNFLVLDEKAISPQEFKNFSENKGVQKECLEKVDPIIWKGYNIEPEAITTASN